MRFVTDFPGGNGKLLRAAEYEWGWEIVFLAESKAYEPMPLWFYFRLEDLSGKKVRLKLENAEQCLGGAMEWTTNRPVARQFGGEWKRIEKVENGWNRFHTLDTWFEVELKGNWLEFAFCFPYQFSELSSTADLVKNAFEKAVIGYSNHARPILRLSSDLGSTEEKKPGIYIIGRQHASEVTGTWVIDGMLRFLASEEGKEIRDKFTWWFVPMVDVDGVEEGFYGKDQIYNDLNRAWHTDFSRRVELTAVEHDMSKFTRLADAKVMLDMHSPGHGEHESYFVIKADITDVRREELRTVFYAINRLLEGEGMQKVLFREDPPGLNTSSQSGMTSAQYAYHVGMNGCTFEINYQGENDMLRFYTEDDYRMLGKCMVKALDEIYG